MFGSATTGKQAYISGNCCVRDGVSVGEKALVGMGAVVVKPVPTVLLSRAIPRDELTGGYWYEKGF